MDCEMLSYPRFVIRKGNNAWARAAKHIWREASAASRNDKTEGAQSVTHVTQQSSVVTVLTVCINIKNYALC